MRFVPIKSADQQGALPLHCGRERLVSQRTTLVNALSAHLADFGIIASLNSDVSKVATELPLQNFYLAGTSPAK